MTAKLVYEIIKGGVASISRNFALQIFIGKGMLSGIVGSFSSNQMCLNYKTFLIFM